MEVDILLNMDGFDDNIMTPVFYANSGGTAFAVSSAFSASDSVAVNPRSNLHPTTSYHGRTQFYSNSRPWPEPNMYSYGFQDYPHYSTADTLHDPGLGNSDPSSMSTGPVARSREDAPWQMYLSASFPDSLHSPDLDILNPGSLDPVYPHHEHFPELETSKYPSSSYQGTTQTSNDVQQIFCTTPLVAPQPRNIQPSLLSLMSTSTQDPENSLLFAQSDNSTMAGEHTMYTSSMSDISPPTFDFRITESAPSSPLLFSPSRGRSPTITKLVNYSSARRGRGLTGWRGSMNHPEPPATALSSTGLHHRKKLPSNNSTSQSKSPNSSLTVLDSLSPSLSPSRGFSSRNSKRLRKRSRTSDESPPNLKRAPKTRRLIVADMDTEDEGTDIGGDSDSDDYTPSRSPSLNPSRSISPLSDSVIFQRDMGVRSSSVKKTAKKGKGKVKGSAALALAVVSQMNRDSSGGRHNVDLGSLQTTRYGVRRRKNHPIPLPIPVPNLNKKSRGRKVPYIANDTVTKTKVAEAVDEEEDGVEDDESGEDQSRSSSTRSRKKPTSTTIMSKTPSGENRTFVCVVSGCGKCFVRSEHLKRHVRSIHTHDKPHPCPFEGCDKYFSRRDNLGQHVRIHLQS